MRRPSAPLALLALAGCAGGPGGAEDWGTPDAPGVIVAYAATEDAPLTYAFADTTAFTIEAGAMGPMEVRSAEAGVAELTVRKPRDGAEGEALEARVRLLEYRGRFENPAQGDLATDESGIQGAWVVRLDPSGRIEVTDTPALSAAAREIAGGESLLRPLFAHLPGGATAPGAVWVDTVSITEAGAGAVSRARSIIRSTLAGDTILGERVLAVIRTESATEVEVEGESGGVRILQRLTGTLHGTVLWDPSASLLVERVESGTLEGTLELPGSGFAPLPVRAVVRRSAALRDPEPD